jgi:hypothetical protein
MKFFKVTDVLMALFVSLFATLSYANKFEPGTMAEGAPPELMHWGKIVGQWACEEEGLKPDGSSWQPAGNSDWDFFWAYNGWGIQDNYTSPSLGQAMEDESKRQRGINLRIYNPAENKWVLTWLTTASKKPTAISALSTNKEVVMLADQPNAQGQHTRYTFFDMTDTTFEWKMELSPDQDSWQEVYRIHATKK